MTLDELRRAAEGKRRELGLARFAAEVGLSEKTVARWLLGEHCHPGTEAALRAALEPKEKSA